MTSSFQSQSKFNDVYARNNLPKIKDGTYVISLDGYVNNGTYWVVNYIKNNVATCFDSFGVEHNLNEIKYL